MLAQLQDEFPDDVRLVYRHFPLISLHDKAVLAAEASEAAGAQGSFWALHDLLYARQAQWASLSPEQFRAALSEYAAQIGLDVERFDREMDQGVYTPVVMADYQTAADIPLPGTPFLLFNGEIYQGPVEHWALVALVRLEQFKDRQFSQPPPEVIDPFARYTATLHTVRGDVVIQLFAEQAPLTVNNFVFLARQGWFDGMTFHRVQPGFVVQTGDPSGTGYGNPGYYIPNEVHPDLKFEGGGWVGMANAGPDSNGSQFFITLPPATEAEAQAISALTGKYTLFGQVVQGLDVLARLTPRDPQADPEALPGDAVLSVSITQD